MRFTALIRIWLCVHAAMRIHSFLQYVAMTTGVAAEMVRVHGKEKPVVVVSCVACRETRLRFWEGYIDMFVVLFNVGLGALHGRHLLRVHLLGEISPQRLRGVKLRGQPEIQGFFFAFFGIVLNIEN